MTLEQLDMLLDDTRRLARASDTATHNMAIATIEIARQLVILNAHLAGEKAQKPAAKSAAAGKRK